jgi:hypothetical protein
MAQLPSIAGSTNTASCVLHFGTQNIISETPEKAHFQIADFDEVFGTPIRSEAGTACDLGAMVGRAGCAVWATRLPRLFSRSLKGASAATRPHGRANSTRRGDRMRAILAALNICACAAKSNTEITLSTAL